MPSSSSAKKVARVAAKSGSGSPTGASAAKQRNWLFYVGILAIIAIGVGVVAFARKTNNDRSKNDTPPRANLSDGSGFDHWHSAFALSVCGKELPAIAEPATDPLGIHTHGDGLIHIHPFTVNAAGKRATMARYWDLVKLQVTNDGFKDPASGKVYKEGETTCGGKATELVMAFWKDGKNAPNSKPDKIFTKDFRSVNFTDDLSAYTLAIVEKGSRDITAPSAAAQIEELGAADGGSTQGNAPQKDDSSTSLPVDTTPVEPTAPSATTTPATTAPATTAKPKDGG